MFTVVMVRLNVLLIKMIEKKINENLAVIVNERSVTFPSQK